MAEASFNTVPLSRPYEAYSVFALQRHGTAILVGKFSQDTFGAVGLTVFLIALFLCLACWGMNRYEF